MLSERPTHGLHPNAFINGRASTELLGFDGPSELFLMSGSSNTVPRLRTASVTMAAIMLRDVGCMALRLYTGAHVEASDLAIADNASAASRPSM